jgi:hypothetical protein
MAWARNETGENLAEINAPKKAKDTNCTFILNIIIKINPNNFKVIKM